MTDPAAAATTVPVPPSWVLAHTHAAVASAAAALWPGEPVVVGPQLPSVTNYVAALQTGQGHYVAKYSLLGASLISVVRGLRGPWPDVVRRQRAYLADPDAQLAREGAQLRDLASCARRCGSPVRFPRVVGYEAGVLVTTAAPGPSLATELLRGRRAPDELLTGVLGCAQQLHRELTAPGAVTKAALGSPHTCIATTFERKFLERGASEYLDALAEGWFEPRARARIRQYLTELRSAVAPLLRPLPPPVLIYGDLKPEHVLLDPDGTQTWIDPGLQRADTAAELAKLLSRVTLLLVTTRPSGARITATVDTLDRLVSGFVARQSRAETLPVLRRLLALWFADWANYLASGLSLPPALALPLPPTLLSATGQAQPLLRLCTDVAAHLTNDPARAWCLALTGIRQLSTEDTR